MEEERKLGAPEEKAASPAADGAQGIPLPAGTDRPEAPAACDAPEAMPAASETQAGSRRRAGGNTRSVRRVGSESRGK